MTIASAVACRAEVSLGAPDAGPKADAGVPFTCAASPERVVVASLAGAGELRAMAVHRGIVYGAFVRPDGAVLAAALASGGPFSDLAHVGADPVAVAADDDHAYVACAGTGEVFRVGDGTVDVAEAQPGVSSVAVDERGVAYWTLPLADQVVAWDFGAKPPQVAAVFPRAQTITAGDRAMIVAGQHALGVLPRDAAAPRRLADRCGPGAVAVVPGAILCIDDDVLVRVDPQSGAVVPLALGQDGARDVAAARGRAFYRVRASTPSRAAMMSIPLDGIGGAGIVEAVDAAPAVFATDGCALYYVSGGNLVRRAL